MKKADAASVNDKVLTSTDFSVGLTQKEAEERARLGFANRATVSNKRTIPMIIRDNVCTLFNAVLYGIAIIFLIFSAVLKGMGEQGLVNQYFAFSRFLYLGPPTINLVLGTVQEIRSKKALDKLRLVTASKAKVLRDGQEMEIFNEEIVLGDILLVEAGQVISADARLIAGAIEVDESLLTGESDAIHKKPETGNDSLYSGASVLSGRGQALVVKVGNDTYASGLARKVKAIKKTKSPLMASLRRIIDAMSVVLFFVVLVVVGTMIWKIAVYGSNSAVFKPTIEFGSVQSVAQIIVTAASYAVGIIPTGLVLLTSMALAVSVFKMAQEKTLIQELFSLENLSRVDTICLDKTGTLTDGTMSVETVVPLSDAPIEPIIRTLLAQNDSLNGTRQALVDHFGAEAVMAVKEAFPFSSDRKWSGFKAEDGSTYRLGAPEFLSKDEKILAEAQTQAERGFRVLLLTHDEKGLALIVIKDRIRASAESTLSFFADNNVDVKIISGDNLSTVQTIAASCGVKNAEKAISLQGLSKDEVAKAATQYTVFARVSPEQKEVLVKALQAKGHKVAMTGDGVNDILALRRADSSITFGKATASAKNCADVILADNDFSHLKSLVREGRRVVNNIERTAILFLMKTVCVALLAFALIPFKRGQMYYTIENMYLCQTTILAISGFFLSFESGKEPIRGTFEETVFPKAAAAGLYLFISAFMPCLLCGFGLIAQQNVSTLISIQTMLTGFIVLIRLSHPFTKYRYIVCGIALGSAILIALALPRMYLAGLPVGLAQFRDGTVWNEFFQPWNNASLVNLASDWKNFLEIGLMYAIGVPAFLLACTYFERWFSKLQAKWFTAKRQKKGQSAVFNPEE